MRTDLEQEVGVIAKAQGWTDNSVGEIAFRFLAELPEEGMKQRFLAHVRDVQRTENADSTDPDDVADMVAHDAAAGLPGWTRVDEPQENTLAWADRILRAGPASAQKQVSQATGVVVLALARAVRNQGPAATWDKLLESAIGQLIDTVYGPGVAYEMETLMRWWRELSDEERALTGVELDGTVQPPA